MSTAAMTLGLRPRPRFGPALRRSRLPYGALALSIIAHAGLVAVLVAAATVWRSAPNKTYVVNLVPAIAAVGVPQTRPEPAPPPKVMPAPTPAPTPAPPAPQKEQPAPALPERSAASPPPSLPERGPSSASVSIPDRSLPPRAAPPTRLRPGDKELPSVPVPTTPKAPPAPALPTPALPAPPAVAAASPPPPPPPLGTPGGSAQGVGAVTLNVADFPYAWYIQAIHRKIQERWEGRAIAGRQPEIIFEIGRDGRLRRVAVGKSSGNPAYDTVAMRAINEANPFPPLPEGFEKPTLTVGLQFLHDPSAR
jgi:TonB family protein